MAHPDPTTVELLEGVSDSLEGIRGAVGEQNNKLNVVSAVLSTQGVANVVPVFDGKTTEFRNWWKSIEKFVYLANLAVGDGRGIAFQRSTGVVSDFIGRQINNHPNGTWRELKTQLKIRFGEVQDPHHAFLLLQKCTQKREESVTMFAERLHTLAEEAFPDGVEAEAVQRQLVAVYIDGLRDQAVQMKTLRANPGTFEEAVTAANREATFQKQFALRSGGSTPRLRHSDRYSGSTNPLHEPMEVDHTRTGKCYKCRKPGHIARDCKTVNAVQSTITCFHCRQKGHMQKDCPRKRRGQYPN